MMDRQGSLLESQEGGSAPESVAAHPAWYRLENQLQWYDNKSTYCQKWYKCLKLVQISLWNLLVSCRRIRTLRSLYRVS